MDSHITVEATCERSYLLGATIITIEVQVKLKDSALKSVSASVAAQLARLTERKPTEPIEALENARDILNVLVAAHREPKFAEEEFEGDPKRGALVVGKIYEALKRLDELNKTATAIQLTPQTVADVLAHYSLQFNSQAGGEQRETRLFDLPVRRLADTDRHRWARLWMGDGESTWIELPV